MQLPDVNSKSYIIRLGHVNVKFDEKEVLSDVSLDVRKGDFIAITGPNGGGKTTLLRVILKLLKPVSGSVEYYKEGEIVEKLSVGYLPQKNMIDSRFPISVKDVVRSGLMRDNGLFARISREDMYRADMMIEQLGLAKHAEQTLGTLSGGQMQRALLGRALISTPEVIVLDEPLSYVDKQFENQIYKTISDIAPNSTILLVSHEMTSIAPMANRHIIVDRTIHNCHASHHFVISECD